ncbi:hypothetical protein HK102_007416 [Quaeritorhiza haematococci]|nr:hypothetical protein HK102_007416 [Quaeritorhiza haematococci]
MSKLEEKVNSLTTVVTGLEKQLADIHRVLRTSPELASQMSTTPVVNGTSAVSESQDQAQSASGSVGKGVTDSRDDLIRKLEEEK